MIRVRRGPVIAIAAMAFVALLVPLLPLADPLRIDAANHLASPSLSHPLGQDEFGRDILSRLLWSARRSLFIAAASALLACLFGTVLGLACGFMRNVAELVAVRGMDIVLCFAPLLLALLVVTLFGPGVTPLILVFAVLGTPGSARMVCAAVLSMRSQHPRIALRGILPHVTGPLLVQFSVAATSVVMLEAGLSFLGFGVVPPAPSWGGMIDGARAVMNRAPLVLLWPCAALSLTILAMNALCDALRDAVSPLVSPSGVGGTPDRRRRRAVPPPAPRCSTCAT
jgi:peptide/nickel transport system permease protein